MIKITDTHSHYNDKAFDEDREELLQRLLRDNCDCIMVIGWDIESSEKAIKIAEAHRGVFAAVGVHPENCLDAPEDFISQLERLTKHRKVKAVGEIGLDYHYENYDKEKQSRFFTEQLILAKKAGLPAVIHSRDACEDTLKILRVVRPNGVMHCFSGSAETAKEIIALGMMISFTGVLTFKSSKKAIEALRQVPADRLMLETDCP